MASAVSETSGTMEAVAAGAAAAVGGAERGSEPKDLFSHLPRYHADAEVQQLLSKAVFGVGLKAQSEVPPAAVQLGMNYLSGQIRGGSARCVALLRMLQVRTSPAGLHTPHAASCPVTSVRSGPHAYSHAQRLNPCACAISMR